MNTEKINRIIIVVALSVASALFASAPSDLSLRGIVNWAEVGGNISSGTGALPAVASAGARYTDLSTPSAPIEYRSNGLSWVPISSSGGSDVATHSALSNLEFSVSGHTGFASSGAIAEVVASHNTTIARIATDESNLANHIADYSDPHGATMTVTQRITVGSGTPDAYIQRTADGVLTIATWARIIPSLASPTSPATATLWTDASGCVRIYDSNGSWSKFLTDYPVWQDLRVSLLSTSAGTSNPPTPVRLVRNADGTSEGVYCYSFDAAAEEEVYASIQLPHDCYKTYVSPHIHWCPESANVATAVLGIEYSLANYLATYPTTTIATVAVLTPGVDRQHMIAELPFIDISSAKDSAVMVVRIFRSGNHASDTYAQEIFITDFDLHYQVRNRGSKDLYGDNQ